MKPEFMDHIYIDLADYGPFPKTISARVHLDPLIGVLYELLDAPQLAHVISFSYQIYQMSTSGLCLNTQAWLCRIHRSLPSDFQERRVPMIII